MVEHFGNTYRTNRFALSTMMAMAAALLTMSAVDTAEARPRCQSKPAVCMRLQAQGKEVKATPKASGEVTPRCQSKPAVCMRLQKEAATKASSTTTKAPVEWTHPPRCHSKPAVCMRLRQQGKL